MLEEAASLWANGKMADLDIRCFLSIGTGIGGAVGLDRDRDNILKNLASKLGVPVEVISAIKEVATATESNHRNMASRFNHKPHIYQRFNVDQGLQGIQLFEHRKVEDIKAHTETYLRKHDVGVRLREAIDQMVEDRTTEGMVPLQQSEDPNIRVLEDRLRALGA